jgi:hypothetical protein
MPALAWACAALLIVAGTNRMVEVMPMNSASGVITDATRRLLAREFRAARKPLTGNLRISPPSSITAPRARNGPSSATVIIHSSTLR